MSAGGGFLGDLLKIAFIIAFAPVLVMLALQLLLPVLIAILPILLLLAVVTGLVAGMTAGFVLRRRLPPPSRERDAAYLPGPPPDPVRRPRGPGRRREE